MKRKSKNQSKNKTLNFLRYLGPGLLVTVGFIDPGNWASNIAAGSGFGYELLWMVTLSTVMLIVLQHKRPDTSDCNACGGSNGDGRDTRRSDCAADVVPYTNQTGEYPDPGSGIILCIYECI